MSSARRRSTRCAQVTDAFVERARPLTSHDEIYDLEDSHSAADPRVRRIKTPHRWDDTYRRMVDHPNILAVLQKLWGPSIRFDVSKLNLKSAGYGAPVEWHQDWAFYPHTNDDLAAVGIMMDDVDETNGPLLVVPGSHKGPILDHHADGVFCGAMDPSRGEVDYGAAVPLTGKAGSITIHHVADRARLGDQHVRPAAPPAAASIPCRRCLAAARDFGLRCVLRPATVRRGDDRAAHGRGAGAAAAATCRASGVDLREPAQQPQPLLPDRARAGDRDLT